MQIIPGAVHFNVVGLPDKAVGESRERVRGALIASGLAMPAKRITVNLAPADLPKEGSHYDLPIALGVMAAIGALPADALLLALDQITDPHNVGAIVRTAAAFGVTGIVTTARHAPGATGVLAKSASGGLEHVPFLVVRNLAEALITLGEQGFTRIGLDSDAETGLDTLTPTRPAVIVLGAEGKGLRERTRACCDVLAKIPFTGEIRSLNVSNAAAIALYALGR
ncbi:TrmH family RNA methyltransferase [Methylobacterium sp. WL103]|uniref:23S rRNA (guanosine(2251)-2'-O)-methyltransferase RlmB n=1 Tax=Methylobacterium sp. WL103 TaxID=2603891 RepID=UPI001FF052E9|nr:TrmH family RNA methyltransferase [Methylobacterium sp. WL103]